MISQSQRWVFIHPPKTAGTSISKALLPWSEDELVPEARRDPGESFELTGPLTSHKHVTLRHYSALVGPEIHDYLLIGGLRHPLYRMLSWYYWPGKWIQPRFPGARRLSQGKGRFLRPAVFKKVAPSWDEEAFLMMVVESEPLADFYRELDGTIRMPDIAVKTESVDSAVAELRTALGVPGLSVPHINKSLRPGEVDRLAKSRDLAEFVARVHAVDYATFGYDLYPR